MKKQKHQEHILVCLSSSPSNPRVIKTAAKMAKVFNAVFTALFIETARSKTLSKENQKRLQQNTAFAKHCGAKVVTISGDDIAYQVSNYAKTSGVTKIVLGRSGYRANRFFTPPNFVDKIIEYTPEVDIYVIPDKVQKLYLGQNPVKEKLFSFNIKDSLDSALILCGATIISGLFYKLGISESNIVMVYIFGVMLIAYFTESKIYSLVSSILAVLIFNFFFTKPNMTLLSIDNSYQITFLIMFLVGFFISSITKKIKFDAKQSYLKAYRTEVMLEMSQMLQQAQNTEEIKQATTAQLKKLLDCDVSLYSPQDAELENKEISYPIKNNDTIFAIAVINKKEISEFEKSLLIAMLREASMAFEKAQILESKNELLIKHKQEELRSTLLRAISHDLRSPLTGISGNAELLLNNAKLLQEEKKQDIFEDIYDDSIWLLNLVENLLSITRFDKGEIRIRKESESISDVIEETLSHLGRKKENFNIVPIIDAENLYAKMDARLISQVIFNLVDNAMKYSPQKSTITIIAKANGNDIEVSVCDEGAGISEKEKNNIFDMFYTVKNTVADGRRGLGLGLALCKSIINAHGGEITVKNNTPAGSIFSFKLEGDFYE